jgi:hypothetical protein
MKILFTSIQLPLVELVGALALARTVGDVGSAGILQVY